MSTFSRRYEFRSRLAELIYNDAPERVRVALLNEILSRELRLGSGAIRNIVCMALRVRPDPANWSEYNVWMEAEERIYGCVWHNFFDICEEVFRSLQNGDAEAFEEKLNTLFREEGIGWVMRNGLLERRSESPLVDERVSEARVLLRDSRFEGPDRQFGKAIAFLNSRPEPDPENCIKDAVGALEGVANILAAEDGKQLNQLLAKEPFQSSIHPALRQAMEKLYAYRGNEKGVAHAQVGPAVVSVEEAEVVLVWCASAILYVVKKVKQE